jgi:hypothetical protein
VQGVPTDEATLAEFRAKFLYSGNASAVGRELKIPERTARQIAEKLEDDEEFAEARRTLRARILDRHVAMRLRVCEVAAERFEEDLPVPENVSEGANVTIIDKRPDYAKVVLEGEKNAQNLAKYDTDSGAGAKKIDGVTITIVNTGADASGDEPGD